MSAVPATRTAMLASCAASGPSSAATDVASVLRALGDPTRLAIAAMLAREDGPLCVCHLEARFELSQPTISHHLRVLREASLVTSEKRGTWIYYALDQARVTKVEGLGALLASVAPISAGVPGSPGRRNSVASAPRTTPAERRKKACCP